MRRLLLAGFAVLALSSTALGADNFPLATAGGNRTTFRSTDAAGIHTPHVIIASGGGGGGPATIADGADVAQGTTTDAACATDNGTCTLLALEKRHNQRLTSILTAMGLPFQAGGSIGNTSFGATIASGAVVSGAFASGSIASGAMVDLGAVADAAATAGSTGSVSAKLRLMTTQLGTINTTLGTPLQAGGSLAANQSVNVAQMNGVATTMGNGVAGTGVQRVAVASDNTPFAVKIDQTTPGTTNLVALGANQSVNVAQMNGVATTMGNGVAGTGVQRVAIASDNAAFPVNATVAAALPAGTNTIGTVGHLVYPVTAVPYTASATGTTGATTATLTGAASVTTYICGFSIRANATAAVTGNATVTGTITGTLNFTQWTAPNASGLGITEMIFNPCVPASATNTSIAVVSAAPGTGGVVSVSSWGFKL